MALWHWSGPKPQWSFVIDTDGYGGGNTREVCGFITGQTDEYGSRQAGPYIDMFYKDADPRTADFEDLVVERLCDPGDDGYGHAPADLAPTPGYANDGHGGHRKLKDGEVGEHPAFQSVAIFLSRKPTGQELNCLIERARAFYTLAPIHPWDSRPTFLGCRLVEERTEVVSYPVT